MIQMYTGAKQHASHTLNVAALALNVAGLGGM
jgi:hypothetical protein